jgi:hypothetical protein
MPWGPAEVRDVLKDWRFEFGSGPDRHPLAVADGDARRYEDAVAGLPKLLPKVDVGVGSSVPVLAFLVGCVEEPRLWRAGERGGRDDRAAEVCGVHFLHGLAEPSAVDGDGVALTDGAERVLEGQHRPAVVALDLESGDGVALEGHGEGEELLDVTLGDE